MRFQKKYSAVIDSQLRILRCSPALANSLKLALTFRNPVFDNAKKHSPSGYVASYIPRNLEFVNYGENSELLIPRGFDSGLLKLKHAKDEFDRLVWRNATVTVPVAFPKESLTLNFEQASLMAVFDEAIRKKKRPFGTYLFVASTAVGKTIFQAMAAKRTGQRTLVICLTNQIRMAWEADLKKLFGYSRKDIGIIQQGRWAIGEHYTLASISTLGRRQERWEELHQQFGCVIVDEAHVLSHPTMFAFVNSSPARYIIGATATDKRETGQFWMDVIFGEPLKRILLGNRKTQASLPLSKVTVVPTKFEYEFQEGNINYTDLLEHIECDEDRNRLIVDEVKKDWADGRTVLVITHRVGHAMLLKDMLREVGVKDANLMTGDTNTQVGYTSRLLTMIRDRKVNCVVAVSAAIKLGANIPTLDRLHLTMPCPSVVALEQLIGRIRRNADGKTDCGLTYYLDSKVSYLKHIYTRKAIAVFRKLEVPGYKNVFVC